MKLLKTVLITLLFILAITFAIKNQDLVILQYYFTERVWEVPLYLLIFSSVFFGILISGIAGVLSVFRFRFDIQKKERKILELEKELNSLRNLPVTQSENPYEEE